MKFDTKRLLFWFRLAMTLGLLAVIFSRIDVARVLASLGRLRISYAYGIAVDRVRDADPDYGLEVAACTSSAVPHPGALPTAAQALLDGYVRRLFCPGRRRR